MIVFVSSFYNDIVPIVSHYFAHVLAKDHSHSTLVCGAFIH